MILRPISKKKVLILLGDVVILITSMIVAFSMRTGYSVNILSHLTGASTVTILICLLVFYIFDLYNLEYRFLTLGYGAKVTFAVLTGSALTAMFFYLLPHWRFSRDIFLLQTVFIVILAYCWRIFIEIFVVPIKKTSSIVIIGTGRSGQAMCEEIENDLEYRVVGFLDDNPELRGTCNKQYPVLGNCSYLTGMATRKEVDVAIVSTEYERSAELLKNVVGVRMRGVSIYDIPTFYEKLTKKVPVEHLKDAWFVYTPLSGVGSNMYTQKLERFLDIVISIFGIILAFLIGLITVIVIKLDSKGPVFYIQRRVGKNGKCFDLIKFRSMKNNAEINGATWTLENDIRITRVGKTIRRLRLDEIPQMWNVLRGDISFIGPRPERPEFVKLLKEDIPYYSLRHSVKPGITGWAQVNYGYGSSKDDALEKLKYDFYYIKNKSLLLDFHIMLRTIKVVLFGSGAR
jgi:sugar transferase (PEP-CTERM system associated)